MTKIEDLIGKTLIEITGTKGDEEMTFRTDKEKYVLHHIQDCCETVAIEDICGDLADLLNTPIVQAFQKTNSEENPEGVEKDFQDSFTWTFYTLTTSNGTVTIRWYGESNGYYSEAVDFVKIL